MFALPASRVDASFWPALTAKKVNDLKLDETPLAIHGVLELQSSSASLTLVVSAASLTFPAVEPGAVEGTLIVYNTLEGFKRADKVGLLTAEGERSASEGRPFRFLLLAYVDAKSHVHTYWFGFPCLLYKTGDEAAAAMSLRDGLAIDPRGASQAGEVRLRDSALDLDRLATSPNTCFVVEGELSCAEGAAGARVAALERWTPAAPSSPSSTSQLLLVLGRGHVQSSSDLGSLRASWVVRNALQRVVGKLLAAGAGWWPTSIALGWPAEDVPSASSSSLSFVTLRTLTLPLQPPPSLASPAAPPSVVAVGWELNPRGAAGPRVADLRASLDPSSLAEAAAGLNLSLMRWRVLPELNLAALQSTRVLLLGAGTLGCHIARDLLAWGVRHITFVDSGRVSHSNPVRQPLYTFEDACQPGGGALKAPAAAAALARIHPGVKSSGHVLSIPMPGHPVHPGPETARAAADVAALQALIAAHDVVYLLTDTRESRWLPTLLCAAAGKTTITVGLGFDMYLVMRHGARQRAGGGADSSPSSPSRLGCYFCNDVTAPQNSTLDRALDQQCTVTRPGVAAIASSLAVELLVALLHHPAGPAGAPAEGAIPLGDRTASPLGLVPHQIRGFLSHMTQLFAVTPAFERCPACSDAVVSAYASEGSDFCLRAFNDPGYLETVSGLASLRADMEAQVAALADEALEGGEEGLEDWEEEEEGGAAGADDF